MKLEVGKKYRTRDGRIARIICTDRNSEYYPVIALIKEDDGEESARWYMQDGKFDIEDHNLDIISEYQEPREFWISKKQEKDEDHLRAYHAVSFELEHKYILVREVLE